MLVQPQYRDRAFLPRFPEGMRSCEGGRLMTCRAFLRHPDTTLEFSCSTVLSFPRNIIQESSHELRGRLSTGPGLK